MAIEESSKETGAKPCRKGDAALLLCAMGWGTTFPIGKAALQNATPILFNAVRFFSAGIFALPLLRRHGFASLRPCLGWGGLLGLLVAAAFSLQSIGLTSIGASRSAFLTAFYVPFTPFIEWAVTRKRPGGAALFGVALAFAGGALMTGVGAGVSPAWGDIATLLCAFLFSLHIVVLGRALRRHPSEPLLVLQLLVCGLLCFAGAPLFERAAIGWTGPFLARLAFMSLFATVLVLWLQNYGQARTNPTRAAVLFATEPVWAALFGILLGERLGMLDLMGGALVLAGILVVILPSGKAVEADPAPSAVEPFHHSRLDAVACADDADATGLEGLSD